MANIICQNCNKANPDSLEICQFCGTPLKNRGTEPLPTIRPGDAPVKQQTSDLENTLPAWLRDMRKGSESESAAPPKASSPTPPSTPSMPASRPESPKKKGGTSPLDFLAGLSQAGADDDEAEPDWLAGLKGLSSDDKTSKPDQPVDWLSGIGSGSSPESTPKIEQDDPSVDWLSGFNNSTSAADAPRQAAEPEADSSMDWLSGLTDDTSPKSQPVADSPSDSSMDWLSGLTDDTSAKSQPVADSPSDSSMDWLSGLTDDTSAKSQPVADSPSDSSMDWLSGLTDDTSAKSQPVADSAADSSMDWLSGLTDDTSAKPQPVVDSAADSSMDWLSGLTDNAEPESPKRVDEPAADDSSVDWLAGLQSEAQPQKATSLPAQPVTDSSSDDYFDQADKPDAPETPDWLAALKAQDTSVNAPAPSPSSTASFDDNASGDFPDWLSSLHSELPAASAPASDGTSFDAPSSSGTPDWLSASAPQSTSAESAAPSEFPDWLSDLGGEATHSPSSVVENAPAASVRPVADEPEVTSSGSMPDWLSDLTGQGTPAEKAETPSSASFSMLDNLMADDGSMPGWIETPVDDKSTSQAPATPKSASKKAFSTGSLEELSHLEKSDQVPDWLANLSATAPKKASEPAILPDVPDEGTFDWLSSDAKPSASIDSPVTESKPAEQPESETATPEKSSAVFVPEAGQNLDSIFSMEMPDWLSGFTPSEPESARVAASEQPDAAPVGENLNTADLPSWVQAMRPVDSVGGSAGDGDDQRVEQEGPLAGFRSVLPQVAIGKQKPKAYSIKLLVDSTQMSQATLLENLIASEAESRPVVTPQRIVNIRPLRWVIGVVLLLAVLIPVVLSVFSFGSIFSPPDVNPEDETGMFYSQVDDLSDAANVLVVFDYQPGYAGEMEPIAGPVIDHLIAKNARLAFVSTSPTGVLLNQRIMKGRGYVKGQDYIDLGYLPGDAAGIQVFADDPAVLGTDYQAGDLWSAIPGFEDIKNRVKDANFTAAIVLTDNPDTGRMWIEQAGPKLRKAPMLMVVSAQAAPMLRPYYVSGQIKGLVSGLSGGAAYQAMSNPDGKTGVYWDAYGIGMMAAELLLVVGGIWALVQRLRTRRAEQNQEEDEA